MEEAVYANRSRAHERPEEGYLAFHRVQELDIGGGGVMAVGCGCGGVGDRHFRAERGERPGRRAIGRWQELSPLCLGEVAVRHTWIRSVIV